MKSTLDHNPSTDPELRTVSSSALLVDGSDAPFRHMLETLMSIVSQLDIIRVGLGRLSGITAPQHHLILRIYRHNDGRGVGVGELAKLVNVTSAFVASETSKLQSLGLIEKVRCHSDRRRLTLRVTEFGRQRLTALSQYQRKVNDTLFESFDGEDFATFGRLVDGVLPCSERAAELVMRMSEQVAQGETRDETS